MAAQRRRNQRSKIKAERNVNKHEPSVKNKKVKKYEMPKIKIKSDLNLKDNKKGLLVLLVVFFVIFCYSTFAFSKWIYFNVKTNITLGKMQQQFDDSFSRTTKNPVDFNALKEVNSDVCAWIRIKNTGINYPVLKTTDNEKYLKTDINNKYSSCGWIFMDFRNNPDMNDKNTCIYGHNLKTGLMFNDLERIYNEELGNNVQIDVYTPTARKTYRVFSCYKTSPESYSISANITDDDVFYKYARDMQDRTEIEYNVSFEKADRALTLSTCDKSGTNRILVHAVYVDGEVYDN